MKKLRILSFLIVFAMVTLCISFAVAAETSSVVFTASEPDSSGYIELDVVAYNVDFDTFMFSINYSEDVVTPVSWSSGEPTTEFDEFTKISDNMDDAMYQGYHPTGENLINVVAITLGTEEDMFKAGSDGLLLFTCRFKTVGQGKADFSLATQNSGKDYNPNNPNGAALTLGDSDLKFTVKFNSTTVELDPVDQSGVTQTPVIDGGTDASSENDNAENTGVSGDKTDIPAVSTDPEYPVEYDELVIVDKQTRMKNTVIMQIGNYAAAIDGYLVHIYPGEKEAVPYIDENDRTMVPVRFVAESLGADVGWEADTQTVVITKDSTTIRLPIGSSTYTVNGVEKQMDTAAVLPDHGRTMVPVRFVAEALGKSVAWDASNRLVIITDVSAPWDLNGKAEAEVTSDVLLITSPLLRDLIG